MTILQRILPNPFVSNSVRTPSRRLKQAVVQPDSIVGNIRCAVRVHIECFCVSFVQPVWHADDKSFTFIARCLVVHLQGARCGGYTGVQGYAKKNTPLELLAVASLGVNVSL
jgi:hypothetical protein